MSNKDLTTNASPGGKWLHDNGYPSTDNLTLKASGQTFENDCHFGIEVPVINSLKIMEKTLHHLDKLGITCDRFNETKGTFFLPETEVKQMLQLASERNIGITFSLSARPEYDVKSAFYRSPFGLEQCRQLNNHDAIKACLDEAIRLAELGCRGIIVYDPGVLKLLHQMRTENILPKDMFFKASSHCMVTNPIIAKIYGDLGANSVTMVHDASLAVLQETRRLCPELGMDIPIDVYKDKGGFIRFNELADIVRVAAPAVLKVGASAQVNPYDTISEDMIAQRVKRIAVTLEHLQREFGEELRQGLPKKFRGIPDIGSHE